MAGGGEASATLDRRDKRGSTVGIVTLVELADDANGLVRWNLAHWKHSHFMGLALKKTFCDWQSSKSMGSSSGFRVPPGQRRAVNRSFAAKQPLPSPQK
ncbi:hypothetical protein CR513_33866, partial [Mucuna pruriens]